MFPSDCSALPACLHGVAFYGRRSVRLSGAASLISLPGCSSAALYSVYVGSLVLGVWLLMAHSLLGSPLQLTGSHNLCYVLYAALQVPLLWSVFCTPWIKTSYQLRFCWLSRCFYWKIRWEAKLGARVSGLSSHLVGHHLAILTPFPKKTWDPTEGRQRALESHEQRLRFMSQWGELKKQWPGSLHWVPVPHCSHHLLACS